MSSALPPRPHPDTPYARLMARITSRRVAAIDRLRAEAVERLELQPGSRVIDAGCGSGGSFPFLLHQVGPAGEVVGIEISPFLAEKARALVRQNGWQNVRVNEASAQTADLAGEFDALLLFATHEILTSMEALDHLFAYLKDRARVVAFGAQKVDPPLGWVFNPLLRLASRNWLPDSPAIDSQPWRLLRERLDSMRLERRLGGLMYLVSGSKS